MEEHLNKDSTPSTPALSLIYALEAQLEHIFKEGLAARFTRHSAMAQQVQDWISKNGFEILAPEGYRSQTVTTVKNTKGVDFNEMNSYLMQKEMRIANGYGRLKDKTFRIAHMGETQLEDIDKLLIALEEFLSQN
jgi:aspartate aminotransferase-like enzyme